MSDDGQGETSRNKPVTMYYNAEEKAAIKREANDAGKTVSAYCRDLVERQRRADDLEQLDAEARLERVMAEGVVEATGTVPLAKLFDPPTPDDDREQLGDVDESDGGGRISLR